MAKRPAEPQIQFQSEETKRVKKGSFGSVMIEESQADGVTVEMCLRKNGGRWKMSIQFA